MAVADVQLVVRRAGWNSPLQGQKVPVLPGFIQPPPSEGLVGSAAPVGRAEVNGGTHFFSGRVLSEFKIY